MVNYWSFCMRPSLKVKKLCRCEKRVTFSFLKTSVIFGLYFNSPLTVSCQCESTCVHSGNLCDNSISVLGQYLGFGITGGNFRDMTHLIQVFAPSSKCVIQCPARLHGARQNWAVELIATGCCVDHRYKWIQKKT